MQNAEKKHNARTRARVVFVLGGGMARDSGKWRTTRYDEGDTKGALGDFVRVIAARALYTRNPNTQFVILGGAGQYSAIPDAPPVAAVMKGELISLGVPPDSITTEESSATTWQQLLAFKKLLPMDGVAHILTNRYHVSRVRALLESNSELAEFQRNGKIIVLSAEEILIETDPHAWKERIDTAYATKAIQKRVRREEEGVRQILEGAYKLH